MKVIEVAKMGKQVAVIEFCGEITVPQADGTAKVYSSNEKRSWQYRPGSSKLAEEMINEIAAKVYQGDEVGKTTDGHEWSI